MNNYILPTLFCLSAYSNLFAMQDTKPVNIRNALEGQLRTYFYRKGEAGKLPYKLSYAREEYTKENVDKAIADIGRDNIALDDSFCYQLLLMIYSRIPLDRQPPIEEREKELITYVATFPTQQMQLLKWLARNPFHWNIRPYSPQYPDVPSRDGLLEKIVQRVGPDPVFNEIYMDEELIPDSELKEHFPASLLERYAVHYCAPQAVELFLRFGANPDVTSVPGKTVTDLVQERIQDSEYVNQREQLQKIKQLLLSPKNVLQK